MEKLKLVKKDLDFIKKLFTIFLSMFFVLSLAFNQEVLADDKNIILATTTSTQDTGLLDYLIPIFEKKTGYIVKTIAVGTGEALKMGERGDADILLVHAPDAEKELVKKGFGINRKAVMYNDFIIIGPASDPAKIKGIKKALDALKRIEQGQFTFVSRGDNSGTHKLELKLWQKASVKPVGKWYMESGQGMGETIGIADHKDAYTIADRGTYLAFKNKINLIILVQKDDVLKNFYSVIEVNPAKYPKVNNKGAKAFAAFIVSDEIQKLIKDFGKDKYDEPLFYPR